ncbi:polysaccharide pyruvyl transferase CsaB [compost metagenome]
MLDAFSTMHVGNGALIDNTYKLCKDHISENIEILSIDPETNKERFPKVKEDIFSEYKGTSTQKLIFSSKLAIFFILELINTKLFSGKIKFPHSPLLRDLISALDRADICISMSGETINDYYRPHLYLRLLTYYLAILKNKKLIVFPQSIGPVFRPLTKYLLRKTLGNAYAIIARDQTSLKLSKSIWQGQPVNICFCPDVATTQESPVTDIPGTVEGKKILGLTVSEIPRKEMGFHGEYLEQVLNEIIKHFPRDEFQFAIMPSNYKRNGESQDYAKCLEAKDWIKKNGYHVTILPNDIIHPDAYQGMQKNLFAFISTRMHVGILGTSAGTPTLMINTQHKIREYMKLVDMEEFVVELNESHLISEKLKNIKENNQKIRESLKQKNIKLKKIVHETIQQLGTKINNS